MTKHIQGADGATAAKEILIKSTVEAFGVILLAAMFCKREGVIRPDLARHGVIELQPVLGKQFLAFLNSIRQNLVALGLDRKKADDVLDLGRYLDAKAKSAEDPQPSGSDPAKIEPQAPPQREGAGHGGPDEASDANAAEGAEPGPDGKDEP
ncbi:MAG: hypothetical protein JW793_10490 [Acidobacteria bacterium]|nr:hypothetical protein [Acidobacteriota bacterium]